MIIEDGTGKGYQGKVTEDHAISIVGETHHIQHHYSRMKGQAYQLLSVNSIDSTGTISLMHVINNSTTLDLGITYIRLQGINFSGLPNEDEYISIGGNTSYTSGGISIAPVNLNFSSGNLATITAYRKATTAGSLSEIDRWHIIPDGIEERYEKWGSIILGQNDTFEIKLNTIQTGTLVKCRITFIMFSPEI